MTDWRFGDVLHLPSNGRHGYVVFLARPLPMRRKADGSLEFWGFKGLRLPPDCVDPTICGYAHDWGRVESLGGHPDVRFGHWVLVESLA